MNPTALELWFEGSYVGRSGLCDMIRLRDKFYLANPLNDTVREVNDGFLNLILMNDD